VLLRRGQVSRAAELMVRALPQARSIADPQIYGPALEVASLVLLAQGDLEEPQFVGAILLSKHGSDPPAEPYTCLPWFGYVRQSMSLILRKGSSRAPSCACVATPVPTARL